MPSACKFGEAKVMTKSRADEKEMIQLFALLLFFLTFVSMNIHSVSKVLPFLFAFVVWPTVLFSQSRDAMLRARVDSVLTAKYYSGKYDTAYIGRPRERLMFKLRANISGSDFDIERRVDGMVGRSNFSTDHKATISIGANYRGITAGLAFNPASMKGKNNDYELNMNAYTNRYGIDVIYQQSKTLSGSSESNGVVYPIEKGMVGLRMLNVNGYYAFNGRRFSYPAAFSQSYIQKRSAGSWLVGFSYMGGRIKTTEEKPVDSPDIRVFVGHLAVGGGYGYNLVVGKHLLFHLSTLPTLVIANRNNIRIDGERRDMDTKFPDFILTERAAIIYNFNSRYFLGTTFVLSHSLLGDKNVDINYRKWRQRTFFGFRL